MAPAPATLTSHDIGPVAPAFPVDVPPELARRFRESADWFSRPPVVPPGIPFVGFDDAPGYPAGLYRGATGATSDRRAGKDLPRFWSEIDLRGYRVMSRWLWETNPFMIGFGGRLTDYHVGKGWQWQACRKGQEKQAYATGRSGDALLKKAQTILDEWRDSVAWPLRSREGFRRLHRDGAVIQRFGRGEAGGLPWVRWINPEQVGSPTGDTISEESFGVRTRPGDTEHVEAVFVRDHEGDGTAGEWVSADPADPAARVLYFKTNTDADVKVGLPDSFSVHEPLDEARKLVRNMVVVATAQAAVAWMEKFPTATAEQVRSLIPTGYPRVDTPGFGTAAGETVYSEKLSAGTVLRVEGNREFAPGPTSASVGNYIEAEQAALRMVCVRWGFPPYMTAKADDINFASSLTAGSPFAVAVEGGQVEWGVVERATAAKVLDLAAESGRLTWAERQQLDVEVIAPAITSPDKQADTNRILGLVEKKLIDPYTAQQELGYDPSHIEANWDAWEKRRAAGVGADDSLRGSLSSVSAIQQLQTAVAGGQLTAEGAVANLRLVFGIDPAEAAKLFPPKAPTDLTPDGAGPDDMPEPAMFGESLAAQLDAALARLIEDRAGLVKKSITNKAGHRQTVWVSPADAGADHDEEPTGGDAPAREHVLAGLADFVTAADPTADPAMLARIGDAAVTAAAKAYGAFARLTPFMMTAQTVMEGLFDTPADMAKFGYNPAGSTGADPVKSALGINAHAAAQIAAHVLGKAWAHMTSKAARKAESIDMGTGDPFDAVAQVLREAVAHVAAEFGLAEPPAAATIAAALRARADDFGADADDESVEESTFDARVESGEYLAPECDETGRLVEAGAGLVAKKIAVQRGGKSIQTTVWVRPDEPAEAGKTGKGPSRSANNKGSPATKKAGPPRVPQKRPSEKAARAMASAKRVDKRIQRYAEEHNEPKFAAAVGGLSFKDNEPVDVVLGAGGVVKHGLELKTMVDNANGKITMKRSAMERKAQWEKDNKATFHTIVIDDQAVYNAGGEGVHDESKRRYFYRRGFGSFRVAGVHEVKDVAELKKIINTPDDKLPDAAKRK